MPKYSKEIKALSATHLKSLLEKTGIQKQELAEIAGRSAQTVSAMVKGTAPVTERTARAINKHFPDYSIEYLMGESPYRNDHEREVEEQAERRHHGDMLDLGIGALADACGYTFTARAVLVPQGEPMESGLQKLVPDTEVIVSRDGKTTVISREDMRRLQREVRDFLDFKIQQTFKANDERG